jgi:hypothetical protein
MGPTSSKYFVIGNIYHTYRLIDMAILRKGVDSCTLRDKFRRNDPIRIDDLLNNGAGK